MALSAQDKKQFRAIGHHLKPVLILGDAGLSEGALEELEGRLEDHELIKVKVNAESRDDRAELIEALCRETGAELVQRIGNIALIYRAAKEANPKLSNVLRHQQG